MRTTYRTGWLFIIVGSLLGVMTGLALWEGIDDKMQSLFLGMTLSDDAAREEGLHDLLNGSFTGLGTVLAVTSLIWLVILGVRTMRGTLDTRAMDVHDYRQTAFNAGAVTSALVGLMVWSSVIIHRQATEPLVMLVTLFPTVCAMTCATLALLVLFWFVVLESGFYFITQPTPAYDD